MRKLPKPLDDAGDVFLTCISRIRNNVKNNYLKDRLDLVKLNIVSAAVEFESAASTNILHTLMPQDDINGIVTKQEMIDVYTQRMVKKDSAGRQIYDKLLATSAHNLCPLCGQRTVSTLDHHLPKALYPALAVVPTNLIPACWDCNNAKLEAKPSNSENETIHPYFDDVETDLWLYATVIEDSPPVLRFFVNPPANCDEIKAKRLKYHFQIFKLSRLYTSHAASELSNIQHSLTKLFSKVGDKGVKDYLREEASSREKVYINSWQTAMYKALSNSDWYCLGGFKE